MERLGEGGSGEEGDAATGRLVGDLWRLRVCVWWLKKKKIKMEGGPVFFFSLEEKGGGCRDGKIFRFRFLLLFSPKFSPPSAFEFFLLSRVKIPPPIFFFTVD